MRTSSDSRSRRRVSLLIALGGSVLLSACNPPAAPSPVEIQAAVAGDGAATARMSVAGASDLIWCRWCLPVIDPERIPPNMPGAVSLGVANVGDAPAGTMHVALHLMGADGRRIPLSETDHDAPLPGQTITIRVRFEVPIGTPAGSYRLEAVLDPENRIPERDETNNTWLPGDIVSLIAG